MSPHLGRRCKIVIGPDGSPLSMADLPAPDTERVGVTRRKAVVVAAVRGGLLTIEEACARYTLSVEEYLPGKQSRSAVPGLRTTKVQKYRAELPAVGTALSPVVFSRRHGRAEKRMTSASAPRRPKTDEARSVGAPRNPLIPELGFIRPLKAIYSAAFVDGSRLFTASRPEQHASAAPTCPTAVGAERRVVELETGAGSAAGADLGAPHRERHCLNR